MTIDQPRAPARAQTKLGVIARLGERLSSDERAPYERPEHEDALHFDEPTGDQPILQPVKHHVVKDRAADGAAHSGESEP